MSNTPQSREASIAAGRPVNSQRGALAAITAEMKANLTPLQTDQPQVTKGGFNGEEVVRNALGSGLVNEPNDQTRSAPKLDIVPIDKALSPLDCFDIVRANQRLEPGNVPIVPDDVRPIICHPQVPLPHGYDSRVAKKYCPAPDAISN
jgi:hypothetical protein